VFTHARRFNQEDRDFMLAVSHQCAQALERARLYEAEFAARELLQVRVKLQSVIAELGQDALGHASLSALMDKAVTLLATTLSVEYTKILELIPADHCLLLMAGVGWKQGYIGKATMSAGVESQAGYTLLSAHPVIVDDLRTETRFTGSPLLVEHQVISGMSVIIAGNQRPWGVLGVYTTQRRHFTSDDIYFVQSVANILGAALERERLDKAQTRYATMLRRSNDELQQFAYIASHDLQEPLRMVTSFLQLLEVNHAPKLDGEARDFIGFAVDGAIRMKDLITALLAYSRVERGERVFQEFDAQWALDKALANLSLRIEESGARITCDELPRIKADMTQIAQLLQNLIGNAIKFQQGNTPAIHISAERKGSMWQFSVRDNGIGIEAKFLERIFVIFQRLHRKDEYEGTGIGLAICKKVVERHGGQIWVESVVGEGTTFYFTIPH
jgi:signal transduction histidine kinase